MQVNISNVEDAVSAEYDYLYVLVYVDDLLLVSTSVELRQEVRQKLKKRFQMSQKVDNEPEELLGMNIAKADGTIELNQSRYAREIYNTYRDQEVVVKVASTPMKDNVKLSKANADPEYIFVYHERLIVKKTL